MLVNALVNQDIGMMERWNVNPAIILVGIVMDMM